MYVEVGSRQTGKSSRLVEDLVNFLQTNRDKTALLVSFNTQCRKRLKEMVFQKCGYDCLNRTITSHKMLPNVTTMKQYVDEFFYVSEENLVVDKNAYYVGTPKGDRIGGKHQLIVDTFIDTFNTKIGKMVQLKPIKKHGFGRVN